MISIAFGLFAVETGNAATIIASSCSQPDVQAAINRAVSGDKVNIPPGNCTWTAAVSIPDSKKITLQGAGKTSTIITSNITEGYTIHANYSGSRITGIGFEFINTAGGISVRGSGWRVDNCLFNNTTGSTRAGVHPNGGTISSRLYGLVDHCEFINSRVLVYGDLNLLAHGIWARSLGLGTDSAVYVEDCIIQAYTIWELHRCTITAAHMYFAITRSRIHMRKHIRFRAMIELHENGKSIITHSTRSVKACGYQCCCVAGTGVVFNNTLTGTWDQAGIALDNVRSCESRATSGMCDGSSPWDGNQINGYPCRDQIGRSTDQYLWTAGKTLPATGS